MSAGEHAGHDHTHGMAKQTLRLAFFLTMIILAAELIGGFLSNSLALLSDAGHVLTDIFALGLAWFATAQAERPANASKTFGYHRVGILAALVNAARQALASPSTSTSALACDQRATTSTSERQPCTSLVMLEPAWRSSWLVW